MPGIDSNTKLMLHCNGADESTTFTDSSPSSHIVTAQGTAQLDTAEKKWGSASGSFDGDSDYLTTPDSSDWDIFASNSDNWTFDCQVKFSSVGVGGCLLYHGPLGGSVWQDMFYFYKQNNNYFEFKVLNSSGTNIIYAEQTSGTTVNDTNWHHVALIKVANEYAIYVDGDQVAYNQTNNTYNLSATLYIGFLAGLAGYYYFPGWIDEIRLQHSNYFSASPNSGLTDTITVPTSEYSEDAYRRSRTIIIS